MLPLKFSVTVWSIIARLSGALRVGQACRRCLPVPMFFRSDVPWKRNV